MYGSHDLNLLAEVSTCFKSICWPLPKEHNRRKTSQLEEFVCTQQTHQYARKPESSYEVVHSFSLDNMITSIQSFEVYPQPLLFNFKYFSITSKLKL